MDFFCTYDTAFGPGFSFSPAEILVRSRIDMDLEMKLDGLKKHAGGKEKRKDKPSAEGKLGVEGVSFWTEWARRVLSSV